jgi:hypothetical protein
MVVPSLVVNVLIFRCPLMEVKDSILEAVCDAAFGHVDQIGGVPWRHDGSPLLN